MTTARFHLERARSDLLTQVSQGIQRILGAQRLEHPGTVILKPNVVSDVPEYIANGSNTDTAVIEGVVACFSRWGWRVVIAESETGSQVKGRRLDTAWRRMGVYRLQEQYGCTLLNLTHDEMVRAPFPGTRLLSQIALPRTLIEADLVVNLPKLKTHKYATITGALKNMFGCIPDPMRIVHHHHLSEVIAELNSAFRDRMLVVLDGLRGMEGNGPLYGKPVDMGLLGFSNSALATDLVACAVMRIPTAEVEHIRYYQAHVGPLSLEEVQLSGVPIDEVSRPFQPAAANWFIRLEWAISEHPFLVRVLFSDPVRKNVTILLNPLLRRLRGGSYSWHPYA